jgi:regulator of RNase E activity RraA
MTQFLGHAREPETGAGYLLHPMPAQIDHATVVRLAKVETATVGHFRQQGFMDPALRALIPGRRVAGTAVTLYLPFPDSTLLDHAIGLLRPGDFLVIDQRGDNGHASWGGVLSLIAKMAGLAGIAIDGTATDLPEIRQHGVPVWCRGPSSVTTQRLGLGGTLNCIVTCGGVTVHPGDAIVADESGVLVLHPGEVDSVVEVALAFQQEEVELIEELKKGRRLGDISGATAVVVGALRHSSDEAHSADLTKATASSRSNIACNPKQGERL